MQTLAPEMASMDMRMKALVSKTQMLEAKLDDQEGCSRLNNLLENIEATSMIEYLDDWLQLTAQEGLSKFFAGGCQTAALRG